MFISNITELSDKAWKYLIKNSSKYHFWGFLETHTHTKEELQDWDKKARLRKMRMYSNPARESGKIVSADKQHRSNEGGEMFLGKNHLQAHLLPEAVAARSQLSEVGSSAFDGFLPMVVNFSGFSLVIVTYYGYCSQGFWRRQSLYDRARPSASYCSTYIAFHCLFPALVCDHARTP